MFDKLRSELKELPITRIIGFLTALIGLLVVTFQSTGVIGQYLNTPSLFSFTNQLTNNNITLSSCIVENKHQQTAEDVTIQIKFENDIPLKNDVDIIGGEGREIIEQGGKAGDIYTRIYLERLVYGDKITVTLATETMTKIECNVISNEGLATTFSQNFLSRNPQLLVNFIIEAISTFIMVIIFIISIRSVRNNNPNTINNGG